MGRRAAEKVCPSCMSEIIRYSKLMLGRDIGWKGAGVQRHGATLICSLTLPY